MTLLDIAIVINGHVMIATVLAPTNHVAETLLPCSGDRVTLSIRPHKTQLPWKTTPPTQLR